MKGLRFLDKEIIQMSFEKNAEAFEEGMEVDVNVGLDYSIAINEEDHECYGDAFVTVSDESDILFEIIVHVVGIFSIRNIPSNDEENEQLHKETVKELMPHINSIVANITQMANIPSVPVCYEDLIEGEMEYFTENLN